jgi:hypothetical protein
LDYSIGLLIVFIVFGVGLIVHMDASAQFVPLPPPSGSDISQNNQSIALANDHLPPAIQVVTQHLKEGKNVFKLDAIDKTGIASVFIKYVDNGQIKTQPMVAMGKNLYEALVDIHPPSKIVEIQATDMKGNTAEKILQYDVIPAGDLSKAVSNFFGQLWGSISANK